MKVAIRPLKESDLRYLYSSWTSFWQGTDAFYKSEKATNKPKMISMIAHLLKTKKVIVACNDEDDYQIFGYLCFDSDTIYVVMVKPLFQRMGIGTALIDHAFRVYPKYAAFNSRDFRRLRDRLHCEYQPMRVYEDYFSREIKSSYFEDPSKFYPTERQIT